MIKDKFDFGVYKQKENYWLIHFQNIITNKKEYLGSSDDYEKACDIYSNYQFDFYSNHTFLLPRNVSLDRKRRLITYSINLNGKIKLHKGFKTLQLALKYRNDIINSIIP